MTETNDGGPPEGAALPMDISDVDRRNAAFMQALVRRAGDARDATAFITIAWRGFTYRRHIQHYHRDELARVERMTLHALPEYQREPWLFGWRWEP